MARKYQTILDHLRLMSQRLSDGDALPSVRDLMREFRVSQATVDRAMMSAKSEGFVDVIPGEGAFASHGKKNCGASGGLRIILAMHDYPSSFAAKLEEELSNVLSVAGHTVNVFRFAWSRRLPAAFKPGLDDAIVLLPPVQRIDPADIVTLRKTGLPVVCVAAVPEGLEIDAVGVDDVKCGEMAVSLLMERGRRRLCVVAGEPMGPQTRARLAGFSSACERASLARPLMLDAGTSYGESSLRKSYESVLALGETERAFDGLFGVTDACALGAVRALHERGVNVPGGVSVLGCNDIPEAPYVIPSLSSLGNDYSRWASEITAIIHRRKSGDTSPAAQVKVPPIFLERESTGALQTRRSLRRQPRSVFPDEYSKDRKEMAYA